MKIEFDKKKRKWKELGSNSPNGIYLDGFLKKRLDIIRKLRKKNWDSVILIDGEERSGKSTLAMSLGYYLSDTKLSPKNFATGMSDAAMKIKTLPPKSVLIVDEGSLVFSSKDVMMKEQKRLLKILDVCGQLNLIMIVCLPSFFDLNKSIAIRRSRFLLHVYAHRTTFRRGNFAYYSTKKKKQLYYNGKKNYGNYNSPSPVFRGRFTNFQPEWYQEYLRIKRKSLMEALDVGTIIKTESEIARDTTIEIVKLLSDKLPIKTKRELAKKLGIVEQTLYKYLRIWDNKNLTT